MKPASLILIAFSHMLDGFTLGIITPKGYPIQKCDCLTGLGVGHGMRQLSPVTVWRPSPTRPPVPPSTEPKAPSEQSALAKNLLTHPEPENPGIRPSTPTPLPTLRPSMASHANHHNRGMYYFRRNMYQQAIDEFTMSIRLDSRFPNNFKVRGLAYAELGQYQRAIKDYDKAIQLYPEYADAYNNLGAAYRKLGQDTKADADEAKACSYELWLVLVDSKYC